jgi:TonB family protein
MADPRVRPTSPGPPDPGVPFRPENDVRPASGKIPSPDDYLLIDRLREDATSGRMDLDSILSEATHAARYFTDATGAALALWSQGVVICRARSGDTAPPLGAKLDVESGVSGECLRSGRSKRCNDSLTDPLVDSDVCQELGIRALAAVPLRGEHGVVGILEVFSDRPYAFSDAHITLLKQLAQIAVTGRSKSVAPATPPVRQTAPSAPVSVPVAASLSALRAFTARLKGEEGQPMRMVVAGALLVLLVGGFAWMLSRGRGGANHAPRSVQAAGAVPAAMSAGSGADTTLTVTPSTTRSEKGGRELLQIGISKPRPGATSKDLAANDLVERASSEVVTERSAPLAASNVSAPAASGSAKSVAATDDAPAPDANEVAGETQLAAARVPALLLPTQSALPAASLRTSQGITGGKLTHQVSPVYPTTARLQRIEGTVVLQAMVGEDGNVREVRVQSGSPVLAASAKKALEQWRYEPFQLNGKPVALSTEVKIVFKLP